MAAMYDQLGNYIGDDGVGAQPMDEMRAALALKRNKRSPLPAAVANIPKISPELQALMAIDAKPLSLDDIYARLTTPKAKPLSRTEQFTRDIGELPKQFADVENVLFGGPTRAAVLQPWEALLKHAYKMPGIAYRERVAKDPQSLREAAQMRKDLEASTGENGMFPTQPLQTRDGEEFASNFGKALDTLKVPAAWPMAPTPTRPMLTGSDIRAMKGNVQNVARQVGDIPIDYRNAQSGFTRMDPVTGKPTVGAKAQALMDDWANVLQRRQEVTGTPTFGGIAPETNMYAVRPDKGTRVIQPTRTEETSAHPFYVDPLTNIVSEVASVAELDNKRLLNRYTDLDSHRLPSQRGAALPVAVKRQIDKYITGRLQEIYPDVPIRSGEGGDDALHAAFQIGNKPTIRDKKLLGMYEDFFKTDEGKAAIEQSGGTLVPPSVHAERHAAASNWLNSTFKNYLDTRIGTAADPLLQKARQGVTYNPASELEGYAESVYDTARKNRIAGGFHETGEFLPEFHALGDRLDVVSAELTELDARKAQIEANLPPESVMRPNGPDAPGLSFNDVIPGYNDFMREYNAKLAERNKLRKDIANLRIAQDYETLADAAVQPRIVSKVLNELPEQEKPFYPSLTLAPPESIVYNLKKGTLGALGIDDMVNSFYNDVLTGKVPVEKLKGLTVDKYVQQHFDKRKLRELEEEKAAKEYLNNVNTVLHERVQQVPLDMHFYNTAVIEFDANTPREQAYRDLAADTTILDHCVTEGGGAGDNKKHFITGQSQRHEPLIDITTGEYNPNAIPGKTTSTYTEELYNNGVKLASVRDSTTGYPIATIRLERATRPGKYNATWVNGYRNGNIDRAYSEGIAAYLNSKADIIAGSGSDMQRHAGVFDTQTPADMRSLSQRVPGMAPEEVRHLDFDFVELPRFVTQKQFNEIVADAVDLSYNHPPGYDAPDIAPQDTQTALNNLEYTPSRALAQQQQNMTPPRPVGELYQMFLDVVDNSIEEGSFGPNDYTAREFAERIRNDEVGGIGDLTPQEREILANAVEEEGYNPGAYFPPEPEQLAPTDMRTRLAELDIEYGRITDDIDERLALEEQGLPIDERALNDLREQAAQIIQLRNGLRNQLAPPPAEVRLPPEDLGLFEPDPTHPANRPVASTQAPTAELYTQELNRLNARHDALTNDIAEWNRQMLPYIRRENDGTITPEQLRDLENLRDQYDDTVREMRNTQQQISETARQQQAAFEMQQTPQRNAVTPNISTLSDTELSQRLSIEQSTQVQNVFAQIVRNARESNIALTPELINNINNWSFTARALAPEQKEFLQRLLIRHIQRERGVGFAKGGTVRIAKTIPAMRAELRRT